MLTDFRVSGKTKPPACCNFSCCGNKFGRIARSKYAHAHRKNRIIPTRRYAKHVERRKVLREIESEIRDYRQDIAEYEAMMDE